METKWSSLRTAAQSPFQHLGFFSSWFVNPDLRLFPFFKVPHCPLEFSCTTTFNMSTEATNLHVFKLHVCCSILRDYVHRAIDMY